MASGLRPRPYLSAFRVFGCASAATGLHIIFMRYRGFSSSAICLSSSGLSNSARCARGVETTNSLLFCGTFAKVPTTFAENFAKLPTTFAEV